MKKYLKDKTKTKKNETLIQPENISEIIDQIVDIYPQYAQLQKDKDVIMQKIANKREITTAKVTELIFDKIILENKTYYKDKQNFLWNADGEIVGIYESDTTYNLFTEITDLDIKLNEKLFD